MQAVRKDFVSKVSRKPVKKPKNSMIICCGKDFLTIWSAAKFVKSALKIMMKINYNNRLFRPVSSSETAEVSRETIFRYHQKGNLVWAEYEGGEIIFGTLIARITENDCLDMRYQHLNNNNEIMTGKCFSTPEILPDGKIRLYERWQWTCQDFSQGESVIEEI